MGSLKTARYLAMAGLLLPTSRLTSGHALTPGPISVSFGNQAVLAAVPLRVFSVANPIT